MENPDRIRLHRFRDNIALSFPGTETIYLNEKQARALGLALCSGAGSIKAVGFADSAFGNIVIDENGKKNKGQLTMTESAHHNLLRVQNGKKPARYFSNGQRITKSRYDTIITYARMYGTHDCFHGTVKKNVMRSHSCARW